MSKKTIIIAAGIIALCIGIGFGAVSLIGNNPTSAVASEHDGDNSRDPNSVYTTVAWQEGDLVDISFNINEADAGSVFAAVMNFSYNSSDLEYLSYEQGNYFDQAGSEINKKKPVYLVVDKALSGGEASGEHRLAVGISLFKGSPGMTGSGRLITLRFKAKQQSASQIILTKKKIVGTDAKEITQISWPAAVQIIPS